MGTKADRSYARRALGEFHLVIETRNLAQLDEAFTHVAARDEPVESTHFDVNA